jgi:ElaB/YqjD/DUF883 family membrane-anchored ribosome-binding protein
MSRAGRKLQPFGIALSLLVVASSRAAADPAPAPASEPEHTVHEKVQQAKQAVHEAREQAHQKLEQAQQAVHEAREQAHQKLEQAKEAVHEARDKVEATGEHAEEGARNAVHDAQREAHEKLEQARSGLNDAKREVLTEAHDALREAMGPELHDQRERARLTRRAAWKELHKHWRTPQEIPGEVRLELRTHAVRAAKLMRIRTLAAQQHDPKTVARTETLLAGEGMRHHARMAELISAHPASPQAAGEEPPGEDELEDQDQPQDKEEDEEQP